MSELDDIAGLLRSRDENIIYELRELRSENDTMLKELKRLRASNDVLFKALSECVFQMDNIIPSCENMHHNKADQFHTADCPPVDRFMQARLDGEATLVEQRVTRKPSKVAS